MVDMNAANIASVLAALTAAAKTDSVCYTTIALALGLPRETVCTIARRNQSLWLRG